MTREAETETPPPEAAAAAPAPAEATQPADTRTAADVASAVGRVAQAETRPHVRTGGLDAGETRRAAVEAALLHRYDPGRFALSDAAREWRGLSLIEMARGWLEAEGTRVRGLSRDEIATARCTQPRTSP